MKILIIRHGDPDYEIDSLTEKGRREAALLAEKLSHEKIHAFYVSPLGRAKLTASYTLDKMGRTGKECPWLREFHAPIMKPNRPDKPTIPWDWLPEDWTEEPRYFSPYHWFETDVMKEGRVKEEYDLVVSALDELLSTHGYERSGNLYKAVAPNEDCIAFFCHFGLECVLLSHLLNISPMPLWHGTCAAPTSVTTVYTEERREGRAYFRMASFGETSHLFAAAEPPAFAGRFCETYYREDQRHD